MALIRNVIALYYHVLIIVLNLPSGISSVYSFKSGMFIDIKLQKLMPDKPATCETPGLQADQDVKRPRHEYSKFDSVPFKKSIIHV